ncbi:hypothetical protein EI94DRAFT_1785790 [Lactarius quietus]|nr:hypothetical protein EI94DRAFT_1785790 [Lactarius quietus]
MPAISFQAILDKALGDYCEQIGVELDKHPFVDELRGRDSPDDVLKLLEDKAKSFKVYRDGNRKLIDWLSPVVQVIHTLSGVLGQAVGSVPTAQAIFVGVDVLITVALMFSSDSTSVFPNPHTPGGRRCQLSYDALVDLFECIGNFLNRLRIYTDVPMSPSMMDIIGKIMVELLSVFALATKQLNKADSVSGSLLRCTMAQDGTEKFAKKLLGEREIEAVLQRLDRLTQEEGRMTTAQTLETVAQTLEVVHGLVNNVKIVMNDGKASTDGILNALNAMQQISSDINKMKRSL